MVIKLPEEGTKQGHILLLPPSPEEYAVGCLPMCVHVWGVPGWAADPCSVGNDGWVERATSLLAETGCDPPEVAWVLCRRASGRASADASLLHHILKDFPSEGDSRRMWS